MYYSVNNTGGSVFAYGQLCDNGFAVWCGQCVEDDATGYMHATRYRNGIGKVAQNILTATTTITADHVNNGNS